MDRIAQKRARMRGSRTQTYKIEADHDRSKRDGHEMHRMRAARIGRDINERDRTEYS